MTTPSWFPQTIDKSIAPKLYESAVTFLLLNDLDPKAVCSSGRTVGAAVVDCISKAITVEQLEAEIGRTVEEGVDKHLPGQHDQKTHGRPDAEIDSEIGSIASRLKETFRRVSIANKGEDKEFFDRHLGHTAISDVAMLTDELQKVMPGLPLKKLELTFASDMFGGEYQAEYVTEEKNILIYDGNGHTIIHEIGHFIDSRPVKGKTNEVYGTDVELPAGSDAARYADVVNAVMSTDKYKARARSKNDYDIYFTNPNEIFASAFEQYAASKSPKIMAYHVKRAGGVKNLYADKKMSWIDQKSFDKYVAPKFAELLKVVKHLAGKHDQQSHGRPNAVGYSSTYKVGDEALGHELNYVSNGEKTYAEATKDEGSKPSLLYHGTQGDEATAIKAEGLIGRSEPLMTPVGIEDRSGVFLTGNLQTAQTYAILKSLERGMEDGTVTYAEMEGFLKAYEKDWDDGKAISIAEKLFDKHPPMIVGVDPNKVSKFEYWGQKDSRPGSRQQNEEVIAKQDILSSDLSVRDYASTVLDPTQMLSELADVFDMYGDLMGKTEW